MPPQELAIALLIVLMTLVVIGSVIRAIEIVRTTIPQAASNTMINICAGISAGISAVVGAVVGTNVGAGVAVGFEGNEDTIGVSVSLLLIFLLTITLLWSIMDGIRLIVRVCCGSFRDFAAITFMFFVFAFAFMIPRGILTS